MERDRAVHEVQLQLSEVQQRLRLAEQAAAEARSDAARLKQEYNQDSLTTEVPNGLPVPHTALLMRVEDPLGNLRFSRNLLVPSELLKGSARVKGCSKRSTEIAEMKCLGKKVLVGLICMGTTQ